MGEEETITETKNNNAKLIDYLTKTENLKKLIHYATRDPTDLNNRDACHK